MTTSAINDGAINAVAFPGSQDGLSLVNLVGNVVVTCSIAAISLHLTASAASAAQASCASPVVVIKSRLSAPAAGAAVAAVVSVVTAPRSAVASAVATPGAALTGIKRSSSAPGTPTATCAAVAYVLAKRSASGFAIAATNSGGTKKVSFSGSASGSATTSAFALRGIRLGVTQTAVATPLGAASLRRGVSGSTQGIATVTVFGRVNKVAAAAATAAAVPSAPLVTAKLRSTAGPASAQAMGAVYATQRIGFVAPGQAAAVNAATATRLLRPSATTTATATPQVTAQVVCYSRPLPLQARAIGNASARNYLGFSGTGVASANGSAVAGFKFRVGATTTASAITSSMAVDFAATAPAPDERLMLVGASDRRMEVPI